METEKEYYQRKGIIRAMWCIDSESGDECLVDIDNHVMLLRRNQGRIIEPNEKPN